MSELICLSYVPLLFLTHNKSKILTMSGDFQIPSFFHVKSFNNVNNYHVNRIIVKSNLEFFVFSPRHIFTYYVDTDQILLRDTIELKDVSLCEGSYDMKTNFLYAISHHSVHIIDTNRRMIVCTFPNVLSMMINEKRFYKCTPQGFFKMLFTESLSIFQAKHKMRAIVRHLHESINILQVNYHGLFQNYYVFSTPKQIVLINRINIFHKRIFPIEHLIPDTKMKQQILIEKHLWFITVETKLFEIVLHFYNCLPFVTELFQHQIFFNQANLVESFEVCFFENYVYILLQVKRQEPQLYYLFDVREKYLSELVHVNTEKQKLETHLEHFDNLFSAFEHGPIDTEQRLVGKCCVCYENNVSVVFFPCAHICSCVKCCHQLEKCPLCRKSVDHKKQTFLLTN